MTREIKFRLSLKGKIVGYQKFSQDDDGNYHSSWNTDNIGGRIIGEPPKHDKKDQFTGLKDKNGKEIYEGDILKTDSDVCQMKWYERGACFRYLDNAHNLLSPLNYGDVEVIGNIYENTELFQ